MGKVTVCVWTLPVSFFIKLAIYIVEKTETEDYRVVRQALLPNARVVESCQENKSTTKMYTFLTQCEKCRAVEVPPGKIIIIII